MNNYYISNEKIDLGCYPNYSFAVGDLDGDGRMEFVALTQSGGIMRAFNLEGGLIFERTLANAGNWGTAIICAIDVDGDGRDEIIAPNGGGVAAFDAKGRLAAEYTHTDAKTDDYGMKTPLLAAAKLKPGGAKSIVAAVAGGTVVALDGNLKEIWKAGGFRNDFGHEMHVADIDGDGLDEIAFCNLDHINGGRGADNSNFGEFVILDHDGTPLLKKRVDEYYEDTHFDDVAFADFVGDGGCQILFEKGILTNLRGDVIWDASHMMDHGQWIAHIKDPSGPGRLMFIAELWGVNRKSMLINGRGDKLWDIKNLAWPGDDTGGLSKIGVEALPTRCHAVRWTPDSRPELFFAQQGKTAGSHECTSTVRFGLNAAFMDFDGNYIGGVPFDDSQIKGYFYNGEVQSKVADVDGDGIQEVIFPKQDGRIMIIKKEI